MNEGVDSRLVQETDLGGDSPAEKTGGLRCRMGKG